MVQCVEVEQNQYKQYLELTSGCNSQKQT